MLEYVDIEVEGVVDYRLEGKVTMGELKDVLDKFKAVIDRGKKSTSTRRSKA